ncbi:septal ring lytic transglycosylase RlpA family protein [Fulvivirga sediminis]|uniref:Probable endolytic peptidoglycan transglycosylase RlpA n=1 Tax=Fulvivirga sediminis TaxID=2803949 RepID=A0A937FC21_9BACT|nr:septal ring lytic transglycosylase RlpA family protein [Fulvivirga sediminis]MBL3657708.1 septal ring lytic transglycosylase RlpA family protein [Fulvivirga sediminis]
MNFFKLLLFVSFLALYLPAHSQYQTGKASYYADKFEGKKTASGEHYRGDRLTAAHPSLPFGTRLKITNLHNHKVVHVRVNDRGPFVSTRIIDLSRAAAEALDFVNLGLADVSIDILTDSAIAAQTQEFYTFSIHKTRPKGFGVQVMSLTKMEALLETGELLAQKYDTVKVTLQPKKVKNKRVYALILGVFDTRKEAMVLKNKLSNDYSDSYIVEFSKFQ